jgi:hypothetical protein
VTTKRLLSTTVSLLLPDGFDSSPTCRVSTKTCLLVLSTARIIVFPPKTSCVTSYLKTDGGVGLTRKGIVSVSDTW